MFVYLVAFFHVRRFCFFHLAGGVNFLLTLVLFSLEFLYLICLQAAEFLITPNLYMCWSSHELFNFILFIACACSHNVQTTKIIITLVIIVIIIKAVIIHDHHVGNYFGWENCGQASSILLLICISVNILHVIYMSYYGGIPYHSITFYFCGGMSPRWWEAQPRFVPESGIFKPRQGDKWDVYGRSGEEWGGMLQ